MSNEEAYNLWAEQYDSNKNKTRDLDRRSTVETLEKYAFSTVIELGCGTGKNTTYLLKKAEKIVALDFSEEMLHKAQQKIKDKRVEFRKADLLKEWKINNDFADLVTCSLVLEHIKNIDFIFEQAAQKLKQNGLFFISELHPAKQYTGSKARFSTEKGIQELEVFVHHISDYIKTANKNGFSLVEINECFDEPGESEIPRLISFVFKK